MSFELRFLGATGQVTGSLYEITAGSKKLLIECGLVQGQREDETRNRTPFPFDPAGIDAVVLSHAHIDHSGRLPVTAPGRPACMMISASRSWNFALST
jgi:metallo-beta-lactamase family protein